MTKKCMEILYFSKSFASFKCTLNRKWFAKTPTNIRGSDDDHCDSFPLAIRISPIFAVLANTYSIWFESNRLEFLRSQFKSERNFLLANFYKLFVESWVLSIFLSLYLPLSRYAACLISFTSHCWVGIHDCKPDRMWRLESFRI